jgi:phosphate transport system permease protein
MVSKRVYEILEAIFKLIVKIMSGCVVLLLGLIIAFVFKEAIHVFENTSIFDFVLGAKWRPTSEPALLGILPMILGTVFSSFIALCIALPIGVGTSLFLSCHASTRVRTFMVSVLNLLAGIPSVVYGFFGLIVIVKCFEVNLGMASGESVLAAAILLSIMILPYIISTCESSMSKVVIKYDTASMALGVSKWHMIYHLILPSTKKGIFSATMLAFSRAMGETMAVMMVIGNTPIFPKLFGKAQTIPALIALEMGGAQIGSVHYHSLYAAGLVLMVILIIINRVAMKCEVDSND